MNNVSHNEGSLSRPRSRGDVDVGFRAGGGVGGEAWGEEVLQKDRSGSRPGSRLSELRDSSRAGLHGQGRVEEGGGKDPKTVEDSVVNLGVQG